jgi:hypothetical protein
MQTLENARHEKFAQLLAEGASQVDAYVGAGYKPGTECSKTACSSKLACKPKIKARILEFHLNHTLRHPWAARPSFAIPTCPRGRRGQGGAVVNDCVGVFRRLKNVGFRITEPTSASRHPSKLKPAHTQREVEPCLVLHRQRLQNKRAFEPANQYVGTGSDAGCDAATRS